jgi:hypothetical protein
MDAKAVTGHRTKRTSVDQRVVPLTGSKHYMRQANPIGRQRGVFP